ncbi:arylacetamide deacetylase-like 4 [Anolis carolinensis]|uniref:arylacetamide deacetylase-like 4 n=1 Tax=Anolis carolinensis TaxID=28377 RepID=UPI002F2B517D
MDVLWTLSAAVVELLLLFMLLHLAWVVHHYLCKVEIPHGISEPRKLKLAVFLFIWLVSMDYVLKKIGIFKHEMVLVNLLLDASPRVKGPSLSTSDTHIEGVPVRLYRPKPHRLSQRGIVFIHGGGGTSGSIAPPGRCEPLFSRFHRYHLVPYQPYPKQYYQCLDVAVHFMKHAEEYGVDPGRVIVCGDSFGGLLAASVCQMLVQKDDVPKPRAQMLVYPFLQSVKHSLPSYMQNAHTPPLGRKELVTAALKYIQKNFSLLEVIIQGDHISREVKAKYDKWLSKENLPEEFRRRESKPRTPNGFSFGEIQELIDQLCGPLLSPLLVDDAVIRQLPDTFILTCQFDVLRDDGVLYKKRLEDNGVPVTWCHFEDAFHGFLGFLNQRFLTFSNSKQGADSMVDYIRRF